MTRVLMALDWNFIAHTARDTEVDAAFGRCFSQGDASETTQTPLACASVRE